MRYRVLGHTGLRVSVICLGTVFLGSEIPPAPSVRVIRAALDRGVTFLDTAEIYTRPQYGASEEVVGEALTGRRHQVVLATKKRYDPARYRTGSPRDHGLSRRQIVSGLEGSLRRLRTDYIDLYYPHHPDPETPLEETLRACDDLIRAGKVRYLGLSNYSAWQAIDALWIADRRGFAPVVGVQALYNLLDQQVEAELVPACQQHGLALIAYSPLAGGVLTGKYRPAEPLPPGSRAARVGPVARGRPGHLPVLSDANLHRAQRLAEIAAAREESPARLAIAWLLHQPTVAATIMGASTVEQLEQNLAAADLDLSPTDLAALSALTSRGE
jgi:aryl-alcohol dehydrogenase-like predicted oxidoreductase